VRRALFLDRDGVINVDHGYVSREEDFEFVEGILDFIREAQERNYFPIVVTNQSGIGRGFYTEEDFEKLTAHMLEAMRQYGIAIDRSRIFHCPHAPEERCDCRKPAPGMFLQARERFGIDMENSLMIGDKESDIEAAREAGVGRLYRIGKNEPIDTKILER
jgi:D-glycero-D-manno-heptose 1,7-bisphosphate phosphatase